MKPVVKWAGGKSWLLKSPLIQEISVTGRYIEPFVGGGAVFFGLKPEKSLLADSNERLIEMYGVIRDHWESLVDRLEWYHGMHSTNFYYGERKRVYETKLERAAQFLYFNRVCWNGLFRVNKKGNFNVPIGSKTNVVLPDDDFEEASQLLKSAQLIPGDFDKVISFARTDDVIFADPPYTVAHNKNGFIKYNQKIFSWSDQERLKRSLESAAGRGARVFLTQADHPSIRELYADIAEPLSLRRVTKISGKAVGRKLTTEALYVF